MICRDTGISKYFRESLGLRDNENGLYLENGFIFPTWILCLPDSQKTGNTEQARKREQKQNKNEYVEIPVCV